MDDYKEIYVKNRLFYNIIIYEKEIFNTEIKNNIN